MTLRSEIRAAVDELTPRAPDLRRTAVDAAVRGSGPIRSTRRGTTFDIRFQRAALLAAAMIAVLLVASVLIGGRLIRDYQHQQSIAAFQGQLAKLRLRPLVLPMVNSTAACPEVPGSSLFDLGNGPVYAEVGIPTNFTQYFGGPIHTAWGYYYDLTWLTTPGLSGPVLIRGMDLNHGTRIVFIGAYAAGDVVATDFVQGRQELRDELVLDAGHPPVRSEPNAQMKSGVLPVSGYGEWFVRHAVQRSYTGCFGFQIDGPSFTERIVGFWAPTALP